MITCDSDFLTSDEVARLLHVSRGYVYTMALRGWLPMVRFNGGRMLFPKEELQELLESKRYRPETNHSNASEPERAA